MGSGAGLWPPPAVRLVPAGGDRVLPTVDGVGCDAVAGRAGVGGAFGFGGEIAGVGQGGQGGGVVDGLAVGEVTGGPAVVGDG